MQGTHPTWNKTLGPIAKKQSTTRNAKISGIELINLEETFINPDFEQAA